MSRAIFWGFGLLAAVLAAAVALELTPQMSGEPRLPEAAPRHAASSPATPAADAAAAEDHTDEWVQTVLARPLFAKDRKPEAAEDSTPSGPSASDGLPRLTGVLVGPFGRAAIFSTGDAAKPTIIKEGGVLGAFRVKTIEPGQVTVVGKEGERILHPAFDPNLQHVGPQPGIPGTQPVPQPGVPFVPGQPGQPQPQPQPPRRAADLGQLQQFLAPAVAVRPPAPPIDAEP